MFHMPGHERDISERARLRFEVWKAVQERKSGDPKSYDRLRALELPRREALGYFFELISIRPDYLQGGITHLLHDFPFSSDGLMSSPGVGAFIQAYIDEVIGYNDEIRNEGADMSLENEREWWFDFGFKHLGNSDEETQQLLQWMETHPEEVVACFAKEWKFAREYSAEFLERARNGTLKKIRF